MLQGFGFRVVTANNGHEAVSFCANNPSRVAVAIIDLKMPDFDGPDTIAALQAENPGLKIIAVSGDMLSPFFSRLSDLGVRHFLPKPFSLENVVDAIRDVSPHEFAPAAA